MSTQVILLERVGNLGNMGDVVSVRPGYARNFLLPQKKALRASKTNLAFFEAQKKHLQAENEKLKTEAQKRAKKLEGLTVALIRQASEGGQMFGSVTARDIATELSQKSGETIDRTMITLNQNFKLIGLFPVDVALHPEVKVSITINIARSAEEAETQAKLGYALIAGQERKAVSTAPDEAQMEALLDDSAREAQKEKQAASAAKDLEDKAKDEANAAKRAKKAEKAKAKGDDTDEAPVEMGAKTDSDEA